LPSKAKRSAQGYFTCNEVVVLFLEPFLPVLEQDSNSESVVPTVVNPVQFRYRLKVVPVAVHLGELDATLSPERLNQRTQQFSALTHSGNNMLGAAMVSLQFVAES